MNNCLPDLPAEVRAERNIMARNLLMHSCADRERAMAQGGDVPRAVLAGCGVGLDRCDRRPVDGPGHSRKRPHMKVTVDQDKCVSSGQCVLNASEVFDQRDEDGVVVLLEPEPAPNQTDNARAPRRPAQPWPSRFKTDLRNGTTICLRR